VRLSEFLCFGADGGQQCSIVYISGRPFVLRDASAPRVTLRLSDRAENLEAIEQRLKLDILSEVAKYGGLLLTHNEAGMLMAFELCECRELMGGTAVSDVADGQAAILPTWTAVDGNNVKTSRDIWEGMKAQGWNVEVGLFFLSLFLLLTDSSSTTGNTSFAHRGTSSLIFQRARIPITLDRGVEDAYLDAYTSVLRRTSPNKSAVVFSCGTGAVRTTYSMIAASLVRRKQCIEMGLPDPYLTGHAGGSSSLGGTPRAGTPGTGLGLGFGLGGGTTVSVCGMWQEGG
jgi:hypothetical protein